MSQQTINNGETGASVRGKLNSNFTEVYNNKASKYATIRTITSSGQLESTDFDDTTLIIINSATDLNITVPPLIAADGAHVDIVRVNTGVATFVEGSGVTITPSLAALTDGGENVLMTLIHSSGDNFYLGNGNPLSFTSSDVTGALGYTPVPTTRTVAGVDLVDNITTSELKTALDSWQRFTITNDLVTTSTTYTDITDLKFPISNGVRLEFRAKIFVDVANTTEGFNTCINGPTLTSCRYDFISYSAVSTIVGRISSAYNDSALTLMSGSPLNNIVHMSGRILTSAAGDVQFRIRTETGGQNVTVKAGSYVEYRIAGV